MWGKPTTRDRTRPAAQQNLKHRINDLSPRANGHVQRRRMMDGGLFYHSAGEPNGTSVPLFPHLETLPQPGLRSAARSLLRLARPDLLSLSGLEGDGPAAPTVAAPGLNRRAISSRALCPPLGRGRARHVPRQSSGRRCATVLDSIKAGLFPLRRKLVAVRLELFSERLESAPTGRIHMARSAGPPGLLGVLR